MGFFQTFLIVVSIMVAIQLPQETKGAISRETQHLIDEANANGPYIGIVIPNLFELKPLLDSPSFVPTNSTINFSGRSFRFGTIDGKKVILVMTGLGMVNAGITTQLLVSMFEVKGVVHYGIAGNANPDFHIGDVTIPRYWAHLGLWNWQRYGQGPNDKLALEAAGDYSRKYGYLNVGAYTITILKEIKNYVRRWISGFTPNDKNNTSDNDNYLNNVWYQAEEIFPVDGTPEERQHAFWIPVDPYYFHLSQKLQNLKLVECVNATTCITPPPRVARVKRGGSASIYVDNAAYRENLFKLFQVSPVEMESAAVALICHQQNVPFITFRALSDLAGGGSAESNEADTFLPVASANSVLVLLEFIKLLPSDAYATS